MPRKGFESMHPNTRLVKLLMETEGNPMYDAHQELKAQGTARALLRILAARGVAISDEQRRRITECSDAAVLERWVDRAATATAADQVFTPD